MFYLLHCLNVKLSFGIKELNVSWSYRVATVRGIPLKIHITFAAILFIVAANWSPLGLAGIGFGLALVALLFGCVTLHEFGHALAAQRFGIPVREIVLLPIGGVAMLGRNTRNPVQELVIAAAGPLVNVAIIILLIPVLWALGQPLTFGPAFLSPQPGATLSVAEALRWLVGVNISLVLFNLIPAFPLDGGRILRGVLGLMTDWITATRWATTIGQGLAIGLGFFGLLAGQITLVIVAALVFFAAGATHAEERGHGLLSTERVGDACNRHAIALSERDRLSTVVRYVLTSYQPDFAVMRGGTLLGVVLRDDVLRALAARRSGDDPVTAFMSACPRVAASLSLADVRSVLEDHAASVAAVYDDRGFVGLVGRDDIREAELFLAFSRTAPGQDTPPLTADRVQVGA